MPSQPPSDLARLQMFCALVDEYDDLAEAIPIDQTQFSVRAGPRPQSDRWRRVVRATMLRKFVLAKSDEVHLDKVLDSARQCLGTETGDDLAAKTRLRLEATNTWLSYIDEEGNEYGADDVIRDVVYGGLLHGDYDKWVAANETGWTTIEMATWQFTSGAEQVVRWLRDELRRLHGARTVSDNPDPTQVDEA